MPLAEHKRAWCEFSTLDKATGLWIINSPPMYYADIMRHFGPNVRFCDRGTDWGNPFVMKHELDRDYVCSMFEKYAGWRIIHEPKWLYQLRGQHLVCHCAPKRCHLITLMRLANG